MPSLTRQHTSHSTLSWWSDRNPPGATISIHAAAKPLIKFLYHRQALGLVTENRDNPLSRNTLDIYSSYLGYKYLSFSTKIMILADLESRAGSEEQARNLVDSHVLYNLCDLLETPNAKVCLWTCKTLETLTRHACGVATVMEAVPCAKLVALLRHEDIAVVGYGACVLSRVVRHPAGAKAAVETETVDRITDLLRSANPQVQTWTCRIVGALAFHVSTAMAMINPKTWPEFLKLLRDPDSDVVESATYALSELVFWVHLSHGSTDLITEIVDNAKALLEMENSQISKWTCLTLGRVAVKEPKALVELRPPQFSSIVSLLSDGDVDVVESATYALAELLLHVQDSGTAARIQTHVPALLASQNAQIRRWTCWIVSRLASHREAIDRLPSRELHQRADIASLLVILLRDSDIEVVQAATSALARIMTSPDVVQAAIDAKVLERLPELLTSPQTQVRRWAAELVGRLASHPSTVPAVFNADPFVPLLSLLWDADVDVQASAAYAFSQVTLAPDGAAAAVNAKILDHVPKLLQSWDDEVRRWTCWLVGRLASHSSTAPVVTGQKPSLRDIILPLLCHGGRVEQSAEYALSQIHRVHSGPSA